MTDTVPVSLLGRSGHAAPATIRFNTENPAFIDFGCGRGESMKFAEGLTHGTGVGLELSADRVAHCRRAGLDVQQGDVLAFEGRSTAAACFAVDLMPELDGRRAFETACANMLRAARDYILIQHLCFDSADVLLARGLNVPALSDKAIRSRPRAMDYVLFVQNFASRMDIVGLAIFGLGEPKTEPCTLSGLAGAMLARDEATPVYRSLRVIMARRNVNRFRTALARASSGDALLIWEAPD